MIIINTFKENKATQITSLCLNTDYTLLYVHCYFFMCKYDLTMEQQLYRGDP